MSNKVYIAVSLDGYIANKNDSVDWLNQIPMNEETKINFSNFMDTIDCVVMGRNTFEVVKNFDVEWPYEKKVFVASNSMKFIPNGYENKIELIKGSPTEIIKSLNLMGFNNFYVDGGKTIQSFLSEDLIDEMIISTIPILLGGGKSLFGELFEPKTLEIVNSEIILNSFVQTHYKVKNNLIKL